jgi:hypothetical protein
MTLKKISTFILTLVCTLVIPFSSVFAADLGNYLGEYTLRYNSTLNAYTTSTVSSVGGKFKICVTSSNTASSFNYELYEYDSGTTGSGKDDYIGSVFLRSGQCYWWYITNYIDGTNRKAELYIRSYADIPSGTKVKYYD